MQQGNSVEEETEQNIENNVPADRKMQRGKSVEEETKHGIEKNVPAETLDWVNVRDDEIMQQQSAIQAEEATKMPFEAISALAAEYASGSPVLLAKIKLLGEQYAAIRRTRGDGNCFYRCFMFSYLEHILETQDTKEVDRIKKKIEQCKKTLLGLGYTEFTFEDFFELFIEQLDSVIGGRETSIRFVTSGEIRQRSEFFEPFIMGLSNGTVDQFCKTSVEPMGEESDHVHIIALSDTLGVPIRVVYLDRSSCDSGNLTVNHHDFVPSGEVPQVSMEPLVTMLYRPGHYDILYAK
ncbi:Ubiquitin thioesterase otubain-like [Nymphaea thermarum]|nr:Ubiquitin thioesterase otubain-like [Nymphaea thermarum]